MKEICVIIGGGSGMGLEAAFFMPKNKTILIAGRTLAKLEKAQERLTESGYDTLIHTCDTSSRLSVKELALFANNNGKVTNVINAAGISPNMGTPESILRINALGTVYVNQEFSRVMEKGSVIVDVASNSAYVLPSFLGSARTYRKAEKNEKKFLSKILKLCRIVPGEYQKKGLAYAYSKNFVVWYSQKCAFDYGKKGIRVVSISPGLIDTEMGKLEKAEGEKQIATTAENRMGKVEELGFAIATIADERNGYLSGVDILCDGGSTNGKNFK